jgi:PAS domain S-box-containing protein
MTHFKDFSIRNKLVVVQVATVSLVLLLYIAFAEYRSAQRYQDRAVEQLFTMTQLIGENAIPALNFMDDVSAMQVLESLSAESDIKHAWIFDADGMEFVRYGGEGDPLIEIADVNDETAQFQGDELTMALPLMQDDERIGTVILHMDLTRIRSQIRTNLLLSIPLWMIGLCIATFLAFITQRVISKPILHLTTVAKQVSDTRNYDVRVAQETHDEIGTLSESFNRMLEQVKAHALELRDTQEHLEELVEDRTAELQKSENRIKRILESAYEGFWLIDNELLTTEINPAMCEILGRKREDIVGKSIFDFVDDDNAQIFHDQVKLRAQGASSAYEISMLRPDGTNLPCLFNSTPYLDDHGEKIGAFAMVTDISERKAAEAKFRLVFDHSSDAYWLFNEGGVIDCNTTAHMMFGIEDKAEFIKKLPYEYSPEFQPDGKSSVDKAQYTLALAKKNGNHTFDWVMEKIGGNQFFMQVTLIATVLDEQPVFLAIAHDITERKKEERLAILNAEIGKVLISNSSMREKLQACTDALVEHVDSAFSRIWIIDKKEHCLNLKASAGLYTRLDGSRARVPLDGTKKIAVITNRGTPHVADDLHEDPLLDDRKWADEHGLVSFLGLPMIIGDKTIGVIGLFFRTTVAGELQEPLSSIASAIALAVEQDRVEEALKESEETFKGITTAAQSAIIMVNDEGQITFWNQAAEKMFGYTEEEVLGNNMHSLLAPERYFDIAENAYHKYAKTGQGDRLGKITELQGRRKDGTEFPFEIGLSSINLQGKWNAIGIVNDITERKKAEAELEQLSQAVKQSPTTVVITDKTGAIEYVNPKFEETTGYTMEEAIGQNPRILNARVQPDEYFRDLWFTIMAGNTWHGELCNRKKNGEIYWESASISPVKDSDGKILKFVAVKEDITQRKQAEEELKRAQDELVKLNESLEQKVVERTDEIKKANETLNSQLKELRDAEVALREGKARYETFISTSNTGAWEYHADKEYLWCSDEYFSMIGRNIEDYDLSGIKNLEETWVNLIHPDDRETAGQHFADYLAGGSIGMYESYFRMKHIDGHWIWIWSRGSTLRDNDGNPTMVTVGTHIDISEQKNSELELEKHRNHLEELIKERTLELAQAKEAAEEASKAKSDFLARMSHEIRTPMNAILGMNHLALLTELTGKQRDYLTKIQLSAQNLLGIINDILDFSKIEAGKLDIEEIDYNLDDVLKNVGTVMTVKAEEKELELLFDVKPDVPHYLMGDPLRIGQILLNLTGNAVKFTDSGEIIIGIELVKEDEDDLELQFSVRDSGIGIDPDKMNSLFEEFTQAERATTRKYGGTGLGLAICKRLAELMGGRIWAESVPGEGSTFLFTVNNRKQQEVRERSFKPSVDLRGMKVLLVEDNANAREILGGYLENFSFNVTTAVSSSESVAEIERVATMEEAEQYSLIIMDWKLPDQDGIATAGQIAEMTELSRKPKVILVTAYGREEIRKQAEEAGLDAFLIKPVSQSTLFDTIMSVFGQDVSAVEEQHAKAGGQSQSLDQIRGASILLVEDNEINQQVAMELLENEDFMVSLAENGKEAVEAVDNWDYDIILMDIQMPEMDGYQATREIRKNPKFKELPIVAMTANAMAGDREKCIEVGMNDHVSKPIDPNELYDTLARYIKPQDNEIEHAEPDVSAEPEPDIPDEIPGINIEDGLMRTAGKKSLYRRLLVQFYENYGNAVAEIRELLNDGDAEAARRLAHTIKGVSGNIAAMQVYEDAAAVEDCIRNDNMESFDECITAMEASLQSVRLALAEVFPECQDS